MVKKSLYIVEFNYIPGQGGERIVFIGPSSTLLYVMATSFDEAVIKGTCHMEHLLDKRSIIDSGGDLNLIEPVIKVHSVRLFNDDIVW